MHIYTPKINSKVYNDIPSYLSTILCEFPEIAGFAIGGSFAKGNYANGEDIDVDIFVYQSVDPYSRQEFKEAIQSKVKEYKIDVRHIISHHGTHPSIAKNFLRKNTPYVVRDDSVRNFWGLSLII